MVQQIVQVDPINLTPVRVRPDGRVLSTTITHKPIFNHALKGQSYNLNNGVANVYTPNSVTENFGIYIKNISTVSSIGFNSIYFHSEVDGNLCIYRNPTKSGGTTVGTSTNANFGSTLSVNAEYIAGTSGDPITMSDNGEVIHNLSYKTANGTMIIPSEGNLILSPSKTITVSFVAASATGSYYVSFESFEFTPLVL